MVGMGMREGKGEGPVLFCVRLQNQIFLDLKKIFFLENVLLFPWVFPWYLKTVF